MPKALVTGATGFIGSHLCESLINTGWDVTGIDDNSASVPANIPPATLTRMRLHKGRCDHVVNAMLQRQGDVHFDAIWHLAARIGVGQVLHDPLRMLREHVTDAEVMCAAARAWGAKLIITSSSEVYGAGGVCDEDAWLRIVPTHYSRAGYAITKAYQECLALAHHRAHGIDVLLLRLFNVAGPRQRAENGCVIPIFARAAMRGEPLQMHNGAHLRRFLHVRDAVAMFRQLYDTPGAWNRVVNVAARTGTCSVADVAAAVADYCRTAYGINVSIEDGARSSPDAAVERMAVRTPDTRLLDSLIGVSAERGLETIVADICREWAETLRVRPEVA